ncbi:MAG: YdcH family protein [Candidatus Porifericomitaceae bacterium WSBS_2022_MAG_OTU9]
MKVDSTGAGNALVEQLYKNDVKFKRLYDRHSELDGQVDKAQSGRFVVNAEELGNLKKEKLQLKDEIEKILGLHKSA